MSPRPKRIRRVSNPPIISGFKPYGGTPAKGPDGSVFLYFEEYEVLRLCDFEMLNHFEASVIMDISRPTFTRIYAKARAKIAEALVTGKQIIIEGGKVYFDSEWFVCLSCGCFFNQPEVREKPSECPLCGNRDIKSYNDLPDEKPLSKGCGDNTCICIDCGFEKIHDRGIPCRDQKCPECGGQMIRKELHLRERN